MPNAFLSDQKVLREIIGPAFDPDEMPPSPARLDVDGLSACVAEV
ncbi:hypothetical protein FOIG_09586 [Fusarium odoratissimum NRRL 54006]|uniref:Uncharacterized protein n=1 Tax=Fusarium odoratissimum (strain NRRL 54006) TaxID=1089451 RepID=X0JA49_FUSO5|nr:uncharacterized protein FOIG_09586 [Fusarium odoratissimum NRRL 54006]EXL98027.1 hypothetical protein FOIG_09586 [Fusarium odoratissimum NRRL 54006]